MNLLQSIQAAVHQTTPGGQGDKTVAGPGGAFSTLLSTLAGPASDVDSEARGPAEGGALEDLQALLTSLLTDGGPADEDKDGGLLRQIAERIEQGGSLDDLLQDPGTQARLGALLPPEVFDLLRQWQAAVGGNPLPGLSEASGRLATLGQAATEPLGGTQGGMRTPLSADVSLLAQERSGETGARADPPAAPESLPAGAVAWSRAAPGDGISTKIRSPTPEGLQAVPKESPTVGARELAALFGGGAPAAAQTDAPQALSAAMSPVRSAPAPPVAPPPAPSPITVPPGHKEWGAALGNRVVWMLRNEVQTAEVKITPPHLGPVEIRLSLHHDQASLAFQAPHAATREALEAAAPRVRELLADAGIGQVNVDVGQGGSGQERRQAGDLASPGSWDEPSGGDLPAARVAVTELRGASGLVDDFA